MASVSDGEQSAHSLPSPGESLASQESGAPNAHVGQIKFEVMEEAQANGRGAEEAYQDTRSPGGGKMGRKKPSQTIATKDDKICGVCGDKALGCNFDAISCESCKAFFRRNALKEKQGKCLFEGNCKIDINTRRFCPYCRLQKCFNVGMRKDLILGDAEKKKRMEKVTHNRQKRGGGGRGGKGMSPPDDSPSTPGANSVASPPPPTTPNPPPVPQPPQQPPPQMVIPDITTQIAQTVQHEFAQAMTTVTLPQSSAETTNLLSLSKQLNQVKAPAEAEGTSEVTTIPNIAALTASVTSGNSLPSQGDVLSIRKLTTDENHMLTELTQVYDLSFTIDLEPLIHIKQLDPSLNQLVNQSSITVLRLIKFAKRLEDFVRLPQECQIGILKGCWIHILLLRSVSVYDCVRDVWVTPRGDIPTEILKNATGYVQLHDDHVNYCKSLKSVVGDDLAIVVILLVIVLFSPEGQHVVGRELVSNIQDKYLILLKHYLESKYNYVRAADMYPQLMAKMKELKELAEVHGKYLLDVNPTEIEPIMLEILDLK